ncbi:MAG TPA: hypothetical protein VN784_00300 [Candidatus Limnocylindrales bacterium]|nr:hypothetical protein [Candidatus Limnocylindrales bacterium]
MRGGEATPAVLAASEVPQGGMNYAVKSREERYVAVPNFWDADTVSFPFLESVPDVSAMLKPPDTKDEKFEAVVESAARGSFGAGVLSHNPITIRTHEQSTMQEFR